MSATKDLRGELERMVDLADYFDRHVASGQLDRAEVDVAQLQDQALLVVTAVRDCRLRVKEIRTEALPAGRP